MKNSVYLLTLSILLFSACEEVPPVIDFSKPVKTLKDSTYIATTAPAAQHKAVLLEDITGVRCINCPDAAVKANLILTQKTEDSVIVMALYPTNQGDFNTRPWDNVPLLNSTFSTQIVESFGFPLGLPRGYVDRAFFNGKTIRDNDRSEWASFVNQRLKLTTPVNISITKSLKGRTLTAEIMLEYNSDASGGNAHKYALYVTESDIISTQTTPSGVKLDYIHNHALRHSFGLPLGNPLTAPNVAGRTYIKQFEYEIPAEFDIAHCHVVCLVIDNVTDEVINVRGIDL